MDTKTFVEYAIAAQKEFSENYNDESLGLISISETGIQVTEQEFKRIVDAFSSLYTIREAGTTNWLEASTTIQDVCIFTMGTEREFKDAGLEW